MYDSGALVSLMAELVAVERESARLAARRIRVLAAIHSAELVARAVEIAAGQGPRSADSSVERERHWVSEEVALVLRVAGVTAQDRLLHAHQMVNRMGDSVRRLEAGEMHPVQVQRLSDAVIALTDEQCAEIQSRMLTRLTTDPGVSISGFTQSLRRVVMRAAPKSAEQAHADALTELRVQVRPLDDGIALLLAWLPAADALRVMNAVDRRATRLGGRPANAGDDGCRLADVRRAQALIELIDLGEASDPAVRSARAAPAVAVTVSLATLLGADDEPGELAGYGPIPASMARRIAANPTSTWRRLVTDPLGQVIDYGRTRYKPPPDLDAFVRARDQVCTFPNCYRRSINCDLDHIQPWDDGGTTTAVNLTALCPRHHHAKHDAGWRVSRDGTTGVTRWTSPTRRRYANQPAELPGRPMSGAM